MYCGMASMISRQPPCLSRLHFSLSTVSIQASNTQQHKMCTVMSSNWGKPKSRRVVNKREMALVKRSALRGTDLTLCLGSFRSIINDTALVFCSSPWARVSDGALAPPAALPSVLATGKFLPCGLCSDRPRCRIQDPIFSCLYRSEDDGYVDGTQPARLLLDFIAFASSSNFATLLTRDRITRCATCYMCRSNRAPLLLSAALSFGTRAMPLLIMPATA